MTFDNPALEIRPSDAPVGAEVFGADLSAPLPDEVFAACEAAFDRYPGFLTGCRCIGALHVRKFFCNKALPGCRGAPRCVQSVTRPRCDLHA